MKRIKVIIIVVVVLVIYIFATLFTPVGDYLLNKRKEIKLSREIRKKPEELHYYHNLEYLYLQKGNYDKAIEIMKKKMKSNPTPHSIAHIAELYIMAGNIYGKESLFSDSAKKYADLALNMDTLNYVTLRVLASIYEELKKDSLAINLYKRALTAFRDDSLMMHAPEDKKFILKKMNEIRERNNN